MPTFCKECQNDIVLEHHIRSWPFSLMDSHFHDHYEIIYLVEGNVRYYYDNVFVDLVPGDFIVMRPNTVHQTATFNHNRTEQIVISFSSTYVSDIDHSVLDHHKAAIRAPELAYLCACLERELEQKDAIGEQLSARYLSALFLHLTWLAESRNAEKNQKDESSLVDGVQQYIAKNYCFDISLSVLAEHFSISESYLSKKFKQDVGLGLNEYINLTRIHNAERLLTTTEFPVTQISMLCGFNDSSYFTSMFKKIKGKTPSQFKKENASKYDRKSD